MTARDQTDPTPTGVFSAFLHLGLTSFGGPIAHLAYFRREFVERRQWVTEHQYAELVALCQLLPGPTSSQVGFSIGLLRAGFPGAMAAFIAFTLPSALLMLALAALLPALPQDPGDAIIHGLKLVAVAVVAHGVLGMARQLCPDWPRQVLATVCAGIMIVWSTTWTPVVVVALGALVGLFSLASARHTHPAGLTSRYGTSLGWVLLCCFGLLLLAAPFLTQGNVTAQAASAFYRAGALVFGGGHVVLPLLKESLVDTGLVDSGTFLAGYGAAQAVPGPMFTLATYLGATLPGGSGGGYGALVATVMIFLPGLLLVSAVLPMWRLIGDHPAASRAMTGINAAVVGLLAAAFYNPVLTSGIGSLVDAAIAAGGLLMLFKWRFSTVWVVLWCVAASTATSQLFTP